MTVRHKFSDLMNLISNAAVQPFVAEHVFANKDKIAMAMADDKVYAFRSPTGETIEIRLGDYV